ncbi:MAG: MFS transporter, partial [Ktedonobacteraceae bacterium]|nr:MFS transporter [Ktedonobacteraceae bacterium]
LWTIAIGFAQNYTQFLILFAIATIGTVSATPIMTEIIGDLFRDNERGRAIGFVYGALALAGSLTTPLLGQLANVPHGWRVAYYIIGGIMAISGLVILVGVYDPGRGATEAGRARTANQSAQISSLKWSEVKQLFTIPSYILMLISRILSGHLLLQSFGIVYMVTVLHFSTAQAAVAYGGSYFGYTVGTFVGGFVVDQLNKWSPSYGRVLSLQLAQALFAVVALFMLIFSGNNMGLVIAFFFVLFFLQGVNPGINRPIVYSVTPSALRGAAFAVMVSIVESIGWAIYNLLAGFLGDIFGLQAIFFVVLVVLMVANAAVIFLLYRTYWPDVQRLQAQLAEQQMSAEGA